MMSLLRPLTSTEGSFRYTKLRTVVGTPTFLKGPGEGRGCFLEDLHVLSGSIKRYSLSFPSFTSGFVYVRFSPLTGLVYDSVNSV